MIERYNISVISDIWSDEFKYRTWIRIELELLRALYNAKIIPDEPIPPTIDDIRDFIEECSVEEATTQHDVVAFINVLERHMGSVGRFVHYGLTSSDLVDTTLALQMYRSLELINLETLKLRQILVVKAEKYKDCMIMGRTHGIFAEPTTFGLVLLSYAAEFNRHLERIKDLMPRVAAGKLSGAVGTYAHIPPKIEMDVMYSIGLSADVISTQIVSRDRHAEVFCVLAQIGASLEKLATQIRHLSRSEVAEVAEGHGKGYKGSSSMPHKRNPIKSENICGLARLLKGYAMAGLEDVVLWHERDISHSSTERIAFPDAFGLTYYMLSSMWKIIDNLVVNREAMADKVHTFYPKWLSQTYMLNNIRNCGKGRKEAHDIAEKEANTPTSHEYIADGDNWNKHFTNVDYIFQRVKSKLMSL